MSKYAKQFKEEAVRLAKEVGTRKAAQQLGIPYYTLADWRKTRNQYREKAYIGSGRSYSDAGKTQREIELEREKRRAASRQRDTKGRTWFFRERPEEVKTSRLYR